MIAKSGADLGIVTRRDDPDGDGRIKIRIPGVIEPETPNWIEELGGMSGGGAQRGTFDPPAVGATVGVLSHRGDPDRLFFLRGPYGRPGGTSDVPTDGVVDGEDRGLVATEDAEWLIQRDSQTASAPKRYRVKHKSSGVEIVIESDDNIRLVRQTANQAFVRGTEYRVAEAAFLSDMITGMDSIVTGLSLLPADAGFTAMFGVLAAAINTYCTVTWPVIKGVLDGNDMAGDATAHLSTKLWGE